MNIDPVLSSDIHILSMCSGVRLDHCRADSEKWSILAAALGRISVLYCSIIVLTPRVPCGPAIECVNSGNNVFCDNCYGFWTALPLCTTWSCSIRAS